MNEQHFDALPPVTNDQQPDKGASEKGGEAASQTSGSLPLPAAAPMTDPAAPATSAAPAIADDIDLIEKEWVEKAKQIVEQTKHDPYQQNEAMTKMKTDYLKKRYNRDIKVTEA